MKTGPGLITLRALSCVVLAASFVAVPSASASYLYDVHTTDNGITTHEQFTEPAILVSTTDVSSFLLKTSTGVEVGDFSLDPVASGWCYVGVLGFPGPCLAVEYDDLLGGTPAVVFIDFPVFTSVGSFTNGSATITISQLATPEPSYLSLVLLGGGVLAWRRRRTYGNSRSA